MRKTSEDAEDAEDAELFVILSERLPSSSESQGGKGTLIALAPAPLAGPHSRSLGRFFPWDDLHIPRALRVYLVRRAWFRYDELAVVL